MRRLTTTLCLTLAVLLGSAGVSWSADFQKGLDAYDRGDYATALREWKTLAEQGNADAQYNLGWMYTNGKGVPKNYKTAVKWYKLAAEQGNASAQYNLGGMYSKGQGGKAKLTATFRVTTSLFFGSVGVGRCVDFERGSDTLFVYV